MARRLHLCWQMSLSSRVWFYSEQFAVPFSHLIPKRYKLTVKNCKRPSNASLGSIPDSFPISAPAHLWESSDSMYKREIHTDFILRCSWIRRNHRRVSDTFKFVP